MYNQQFRKNEKIGLVGTLLGGVALGLPLIAVAPASAQLNPCPGLYYEEPYNSSYLVPEGCPPNSITELLREGRDLSTQSDVSDPQTQVSPLPSRETILSDESPESEYLGALPATANIATIRIENITNVPITYRVTGETDWRTLMPAQQETLSELPIPVSIVMSRNDDGFIGVVPNATDDNTVYISLDEANSLTEARRSVEITEDGQIYAF